MPATSKGFPYPSGSDIPNVPSDIQGLATSIDTFLDNKANLASPTFTGIPAAPTANSGTNTTQIATTAFVRTEVSNLIASAPSTLDTLNELATALGNDANFSTTVTNSLATKAPLASPNFTGTPVAPTAAADTNTTQIATTAFMIGQASSSNPIIDGTAAIGTSLKYARADHVHPTDTSRLSTSGGTISGSLVVTGTFDANEIRETVVDVTLASNVGTLDWTAGNIYYIATAPTASMTFNVTNVPTDNSKMMTINVFVTQGSTGYIPTTFQIGGASQTIRWPGGTAPTPTSSAGKIDIFSFTMQRTSAGSWIVYGGSSVNF